MTSTQSKDGVEIHYSITKASEPKKGVILFLHGVFGEGEDWRHHQYHTHLRNYDLIYMDLRGHGNSFKSHQIQDYKPLNQADDIHAIIETEQINKAILWGYSYGARMAVAFALKYPDRVAKVIMGGMHPYSVDNVHDAVRSRQNVIQQGMDTWVKYLESKEITLDEYKKDSLLQNDHQALVTVDDAILQWNGFHQLKQLRKNSIEIIMYIGERDQSYLPLANKYLNENETAKLFVVEGKNHFTAYFDSKDIVGLLHENDIL